MGDDGNKLDGGQQKRKCPKEEGKFATYTTVLLSSTWRFLEVQVDEKKNQREVYQFGHREIE